MQNKKLAHIASSLEAKKLDTLMSKSFFRTLAFPRQSKVLDFYISKNLEVCIEFCTGISASELYIKFFSLGLETYIQKCFNFLLLLTILVSCFVF